MLFTVEEIKIKTTTNLDCTNEHFNVDEYIIANSSVIYQIAVCSVLSVKRYFFE